MKVALVGHGALFLDMLEEFEEQGHQVIGYLERAKTEGVTIPYLGDDSTTLPPDVRKFVTVGGIGRRISLRTRLYSVHSQQLTNLIFRDASISRYARITPDSGIMVMAQSLVRSNVFLSPNTFVNSLCNLGHDVQVGQNSQISNGVLVGGSTKIGSNCFIGQGANIFEGLTIGDNCIIGANALVTKDVPDNSFVINKDQIIPMQATEQ